MQWKKRSRLKRYCSVTRRKLRHFPPASGRMTPTSVCLWRHREHGDDNKRWRQRRFESSQEMGVKKMKKWQSVVGIHFIIICECVRSCKFYPKLRLASGFTLTKSTRTVTLQDVQPRYVTSAFHNQGRKWQFPFGNIRKTTKKATSNVIFSRTADRIAAKFCMTI